MRSITCSVVWQGRSFLSQVLLGQGGTNWSRGQGVLGCSSVSRGAPAFLSLPGGHLFMRGSH